jgi:hypothetical protein
MKRTAIIHMLALLVGAAAGGSRLAAQTRPPDPGPLRASVERRFDVLPLRDGMAFRPRDASRGIRSIEVTGGLISLDGQPSTGAELREKLGQADAGLILQLSYLSDAERRAMFAPPLATPPAAAPPPEPAPVLTPPTERRDFPRLDRRRFNNRDGDRVSIGNSAVVREGETVDGDVVAVGGSVTVDGDVRGDVVAVGGGITLGPKASVANNVIVVGGSLRRDPAARIGGRVQEIRIGSLDFGNWRWPVSPMRIWWGSMVGSAFALVGTLTRLAILCLLSALVVLFGQRYVERAAVLAATDTFKAGAIGFLSQLLFLPILVIVIVVLVMTIVGIPLLLLIPFLLLGLAIVGLVGFTSVAYRLGGLVAARFGWPTGNPYLTTIAGVVLVLSPLLLARLIGLGGVVMVPFTFGLGLIGTLVEYVAWTVGFGAVALTRFNRGSAQTSTAA